MTAAVLDETPPADVEAPAEEKPKVTKPGVYDLSNADYHADPVEGGSLSSSGARKLLPPSCPALFKYQRDHGRPPKREFDFGHAAHKLVLGVGDEIVPIDAGGYQTKAARETRDAAYDAGKVPLLAHEMTVVEAMAGALRAHEFAAKLLDPARGVVEQSLFCIDDETGVWRRARPDFLPYPTGGRTILTDYKGLAVDTPIPTPSGWTTMGALRVGDQVFAGSGEPCSVTHKSEVHWRRCYRLRFDDGSSVICDDEHRWLTTTIASGWPRTVGPATVKTTEEIRQTLWRYGHRHHKVALAGALVLPAADLPVSPYVLGAWIGDGEKAGGRITSGDPEVFDLIKSCGYGVSGASADGITRTVYGLRTQLREAGYLGHKRIPAIYQRASVEQRVALLRGLMDTDGSWNATRHQAIFTTVDKALADGVRELACGLGQRAIVHTYIANGYGRVIEAYRVTFTPLGGLVPFALPRKADPVSPPSRRVRSRHRLVMAVDEVPTVPTQCITVDSLDSTYLCTEHMIPTHNTANSAAPDRIEKAIHDYGYHQQADWYLDVARALGLAGRDAVFTLIVQEKTPPYIVTVAQISQIALTIGRDLNREALRTYRECVDADHWPGYTEGLAVLGVPRWVERAYYADNR